MNTITYQTQYKAFDPSRQEFKWFNAGNPVQFEDTALSMVMANPHKYTGNAPTHRMLRVTTEVVVIETQVKFKEIK